MKRYLVMACLSFSSCTMIAPPVPTPDMVGEGCKDVDCVVEAVDSHLESLDGKYHDRRMDFMDGYPEVDLSEMKKQGLLVVEQLGFGKVAAIFAVSTVVTLGNVPIVYMGSAQPYPGYFGDMQRCEIEYWPTSGYHWLVHELEHCAGYGESTPWIDDFFFGITEKQKYAMEVEGVDDWKDTSVYHLYQKGGWEAINKNIAQEE